MKMCINFISKERRKKRISQALLQTRSEAANPKCGTKRHGIQCFFFSPFTSDKFHKFHNVVLHITLLNSKRILRVSSPFTIHHPHNSHWHELYCLLYIYLPASESHRMQVLFFSSVVSYSSSLLYATPFASDASHFC